MQQDWWYTDFLFFFFQFCEQWRAVQITAVIAALLALSFQMLTRSAGDSKQMLLHADDENK